MTEIRRDKKTKYVRERNRLKSLLTELGIREI